MTSNPPQLGSIPAIDEISYPKTSSNTASTPRDVKNSFAESAQSALNNVANHPAAQDIKNTVSNGEFLRPVGQSVKNQYATTANEFQNLADSRNRPTEKTVTGQPLTHYHSMFHNLLSWQNPRATSIAFVINVALIFAARYIPLVPYVCKVLYLTLGATATAEIMGKFLFNSGFASQLRPRKYYTLPKESVDQALEDVHELLNFFVLETQRILFAESLYKTVTAFLAALSGYLLIKIVPSWGLALIGTTVLYIAPFVYINNREMIDAQIHSATDIINKQTHQIREVAGHHTARASETVKSYAGDYTAKAQEMLSSARQGSVNAASNLSHKASATANSVPNQASSAAKQASNVASNATSNVQASTPGRSSSGAGSIQPTAAGSLTSSSAYKSTDFPLAPSSGPTTVSEQFKTTADGLAREAGLTDIKKSEGPIPAS